MSAKHPWPSEEDLSALVCRASGQFLYASTVVRFIDSDMVHPTHQFLQGRSAAFSIMDDLYTQILESCHSQENLLRFLSVIQCFRPGSNYKLTVANLAVVCYAVLEGSYDYAIGSSI